MNNNDVIKKLRGTRDKRAHTAGEGTWFRKTDRTKVRVEVSFYPRLRRYIIEGETRTSITLKELKANYDRLRLTTD